MYNSPIESKSDQSSSPKGVSWKWILGIIGGAGFLVMLLCCGGGFGLAMFGMNMVEQELQAELSELPEVKEHVGEITKFKTNFQKSSEIEDYNSFVYDVEGTKGKVEMTVESEMGPDGNEKVSSASIRLQNGDVIEVNIEDY